MMVTVRMSRVGFIKVVRVGMCTEQIDLGAGGGGGGGGN